ncbi:hypothetical protein E4T47_06121 [Aureobasidium subglaciale]|nr:hypothetical protein E4T47_06121 [Aureobasidium subglaciale]
MLEFGLELGFFSSDNAARMRLTPVFFASLAGLCTVQANSFVTVTRVTTKDVVVPPAIDQQHTTSIAHLDARNEFRDDPLFEEQDLRDETYTLCNGGLDWCLVGEETLAPDTPDTFDTPDTRLTSYYITSPYTSLIVSTIGVDGPNIHNQPDKTTVVRVTSFLNVTPTAPSRPPPPPEPEPIRPRRGCPSHICDIMPYPDHLCLNEKWSRNHPLVIEGIAYPNAYRTAGSDQCAG